MDFLTNPIISVPGVPFKVVPDLPSFPEWGESLGKASFLFLSAGPVVEAAAPGVDRGPMSPYFRPQRRRSPFSALN